jgi:hypothetical protein
MKMLCEVTAALKGGKPVSMARVHFLFFHFPTPRKLSPKAALFRSLEFLN